MNLSRAATLVYAALAFLSGVLTVPNLARASLAPTVEGEPTAPASDWITMGLDCKVFAAGDLTGDGWADFLTINGNGELCVAASVNGWKSAAWKPVAQDLGASAVALALATSDSGTQVLVVHPNKVTVLSGYEGDKLATRREIAVGEGVELVAVEGDLVTDQMGRRWRVAGEALAEVSGTTAASRPQDVAGAATLRAFKRISPPPYEPEAPELARLGSAFSPEGGELTWGVFKATRPHAHLAVRMAVTTPVPGNDGDADGLADDEEKSSGTHPLCRDTDDDGLLDGWEVHGLPRSLDPGPLVSLYNPAAPSDAQDRQLSPLRQDVLVAVSYFPDVDPGAFQKQMPHVQRMYQQIPAKNPDGSTGIRVHFIERGKVPPEDTRHPWWNVGRRHLPREWRGIVHWMQVTGGGGGQSSQTGDMGSSSNGWAAFAHELGHQLSLSHSGDSGPGLCPLYPSLMNYAYSYSFDGDGNAIHFSTGQFRDVILDERKLEEKLPFPHEQVKFLANHPFRFTLKDNGDGTTLIDWNHNGTFDTGTVEADINYGYSTHAGDRKTHELIGSAPSLAYIGGVATLAAASHKHTDVTVKAYLGDAKWSAAVDVPGSPTIHDPVLIGGPGEGLLLFRRPTEWRIARITPGATPKDAPVIGQPQALVDLPLADVSGIRVNDRYLLITRYDDDRLEARWLALKEKPALTGPTTLRTTSQVPVGLAIHPTEHTITLVGADRGEKTGPFNLHIVLLKTQDNAIRESPPVLTHNGKTLHCTSRPVPVFRGQGKDAQLAIFHTGWPAENGTWTGHRTLQVKNTALGGGWLTNQMYDEWTRSRVALGFADGPQGAIYAFRWDPGDHGEWKVNTMFVAHEGWGIDAAPMRDFDDTVQMSRWGIRHSILTMMP